MSQDLLIPLLGSMAVSYLASPLMIRFAAKRDLYALADEDRKIHDRPVPYLGGFAILAGLLTGFLLTALFSDYPGPNTEALRTAGFVLGAVLIVLFGFVDDRRGMSPRNKLLAQVLVALIVLGCGTRVEVIRNPFNGLLELGWLSWPLTIFWIVGIINALNLIDGLDGLAGGISLIAAASFAVIGMTKGQAGDVLIAVIIMGATIGFLPWNFHPARMFLGDSGSQLLGLSLAVLSINGGFKSTTALTVVVPMLILAVPIYDTGWAILRRALGGRPIYAADREHVHHRLMGLGLSHRGTVSLLYLVALFLAVAAVMLGTGSG
jgi:UDP-GlcNAc:undecaprenyl-phosphate GlcNAc-1-phosphate transferase